MIPALLAISGVGASQTMPTCDDFEDQYSCENHGCEWNSFPARDFTQGYCSYIWSSPSSGGSTALGAALASVQRIADVARPGSCSTNHDCAGVGRYCFAAYTSQCPGSENCCRWSQYGDYSLCRSDGNCYGYTLSYNSPNKRVCYYGECQPQWTWNTGSADTALGYELRAPSKADQADPQLTEPQPLGVHGFPCCAPIPEARPVDLPPSRAPALGASNSYSARPGSCSTNQDCGGMDTYCFQAYSNECPGSENNCCRWSQYGVASLCYSDNDCYGYEESYSNPNKLTCQNGQCYRNDD